MKKIIAVVMVVLLLLCTEALAYPQLRFVHQQGGSVYGILIKNTTAFVNETSKVTVYDISNPNSPQYINEISYGGSAVRLTAQRGNYLFVAYEKVMRVYNIADKNNIRDVAGYRHDSSYVTAITVDSNYVYLAAHSKGLCIISASDSILKNWDNTKALTAVYTGGFGIITAIKKVGNYLYMGTNSTGAEHCGALVIADILNPRVPVEKAYYSILHLDNAEKFMRVSQVDVNGNYVYVSTNDSTVTIDSEKCGNGIYIFNSEKAKNNLTSNSVQLDTPTLYRDLKMPLPRRISDIKIYGQIMYICEQDGKCIKAADISNPTNPVVVSTTSTKSGEINGPRDFLIKGDYAYFADNSAGFAVYELNAPEIADAYFVRNGEKLYSTDAGKVAFCAEFNNYSSANRKFEATMTLALYRNGKLADITAKNDIILPKNTDNYKVTTAELDIPSDGGKYTAKAMLVTDTGNIKPLKRAEFINSVTKYSDYYVDPINGNDSADGTADNPVRTLKCAKTMVNAVKHNMTGDIYIHLMPGRYSIGETEVFREEDSGENGFDIVYKGTEGTVISGGTSAKVWELYDASKNIYAAESGGRYARQIYVDGKRAVRARSEGGLSDISTDNGENGFTTSDMTLNGLSNISDVELVFRKIWTNPRVAVKSVELSGGKLNVEMSQPAWFKARNNGQPSVTEPWYIENAYELLDSENEFYIDKTSKKMYYNTQNGSVPQEAVVPKLQTLIQITGTDADSHVHNIRFENIAFEHTAWEKPTEDGGYVENQNNYSADGYDIYVPPAAVEIKNADNIKITGCKFSKLGSIGLKAETAVQDLDITGNKFTDISGGAMCIGLPGTVYMPEIINPQKYSASLNNISVKNNYIDGIGNEYRGSAALSVGFVSNSAVEHNEICNIPYSGIHIGWGWTLVTNSAIENLNVRYNYIHDIMNPDDGLYDGGAIYTLGGTSGNNLIAENYIANQMNICAALYADNGSSNYRIENNVINEYNVKWDGSEPIWALGNNGAYDIVYSENYTTTNVFYMRGKNMTVSDTVHVPNAMWDSKALAIIANAGLEAQYAYLRE